MAPQRVNSAAGRASHGTVDASINDCCMLRGSLGLQLYLDEDGFNERAANRRAGAGAIGHRSANNPAGACRTAATRGGATSGEFRNECNRGKIQVCRGAPDQTGGRSCAAATIACSSGYKQIARTADAQPGGLGTTTPRYARDWRIHQTFIEKSGGRSTQRVSHPIQGSRQTPHCGNAAAIRPAVAQGTVTATGRRPVAGGSHFLLARGDLGNSLGSG